MNVKLSNYGPTVDIVDNNIILSVPAKDLINCSPNTANPSVFCWKLKLELHLRDSEVVGIPIINKDLKDQFKLIGCNFNNPLMGTHDNLYLKIARLCAYTSNNINEMIPLVSIKLVSKTYWKLAKSRYIDGIISKPINIITNDDRKD
jgi:hypothetical protein